MNGIILLHKPPGITSFQALGAVKKKTGTRKVGHAGTLDKFASGLLIVAVGKYTRLLSLFMVEEKEYVADALFGIGTDTLDPEGRQIAAGNVPERIRIENILPEFRGDIRQRPPEYSAVHVNGVRAWRAARKGVAVRPEPRPVHVSVLNLEGYAAPHAVLRIVCSRGTYVRALIRDIAAGMGTCAHLSRLTRVRIGRFTLAEAVSPDDYDPARHLLKAEHVLGRLCGITLVRVLPGWESHVRSGRALRGECFSGQPGQGLNAVLNSHGELIAVVDRGKKNMRYMMVVPE
jgi:tRNA pseudouridine55 synthase